MTFERLEAKRLENEERLREGILGLRARRCLSWLGRAEREMMADDHVAAFIFYWIAFNAAYVDGKSEAAAPSERASFGEYFDEVLLLDASGTGRELWPSWFHCS